MRVTEPARKKSIYESTLESNAERLQELNLQPEQETVTAERRRKRSFVAEFLRTTSEADNTVDVFGRHIETKKDNASILIKRYFGDVENRIFEVFGNRDTRKINIYKFFSGILETGLRLNDPRLKETMDELKKIQELYYSNEDRKFDLDYETFLGVISHNLDIIVKAFSFSFVIPDFGEFTHPIDNLYQRCLKNTSGKVASYIPQLMRQSPELWGVAVCTVDGQRHAIGDVNTPFTLQSCSKPMTYSIAAAEYGANHVHSFIGMEPSGRFFNELCLDHNNKPHNPMINAGAIMTAALIRPELSSADRFDYVFNQYKRLCGSEYLGFNNAVFLSERECADRNFALAYFMRENKCFPTGTKINDVLDFYFQLCSLEITAQSGAVMAATLANGGINPITGDPVLTVEAVRNTLALMHSCGMYNYSGQFAFQVGLPAKSGVSGGILLVVPNTLGICLWSPALDGNGNSCRGVQFCKELVSKFKFHHFDNLRSHICSKVDPRIGKNESKGQSHFDLLFSVAAGDLSSVRRHALAKSNMNATDYDGRTALHVAAAEGHTDIVDFLLNNCNVYPSMKDRWGRSPIDDARHFENTNSENLINNYIMTKDIEDDTSLPSDVSTQYTVTTPPKKKSFDVVSSIAEILSVPNLRFSGSSSSTSAVEDTSLTSGYCENSDYLK